MNALIPTITTAIDHDALRAQCEALVSDTFTKKKMAQESGIAYGTLTNWLNGTYEGRNEVIAEKIKAWLDSRQQRAQVTSLNVISPPFQMTPTAEELWTTCMYAQALRDFGVVVGPAGVGKTTLLKQYKATNPNVWLVTIEPLIKTASAMMQEICTVMGVVEKSATRLPRAIRRFTEDKQGLLIIDEAQHLDVSSLEQLRALNADGEGVAVVICGNVGIIGKLEGLSRSNDQLYSRVGGRKVLRGSLTGDMDRMIAAWGVTDPDEVKFLTKVASKPGHLRNLDKCMKRANVLAAGEGVARGLPHLRAAWANLAPGGSVRSEE